MLSDTTICRYNSTWYCMPVKAQKLLLFIMLRSSTESVINIFGFFVASHAGFTTVILSVCYCIIDTVYLLVKCYCISVAEYVFLILYRDILKSIECLMHH